MKRLRMRLRRHWRLGAMGVAIWTTPCFANHEATLPLHAERTTPYDLEISGLLAEHESGPGFLRWQELRALPTKEIELSGEFVKGEQALTVVFLDELWRRLPIENDADTILATCSDGYLSVFTREQMRELRPFLVLEINGQGPEVWPPPGLKFNPGPYVITVSPELAPAVKTFLDVNHKRPWSVTKLEVVRAEERFAPAASGKWAHLSERGIAGRKIWINACLSCHRGPGGLIGGSKSDRPFEVIAAYAKYDPDYFRRYVRDPQGVISGAKMEAHPHYTEAQLDEIIAFITAEQNGE